MSMHGKKIENNIYLGICICETQSQKLYLNQKWYHFFSHLTNKIKQKERSRYKLPQRVKGPEVWTGCGPIKRWDTNSQHIYEKIHNFTGC